MVLTKVNLWAAPTRRSGQQHSPALIRLELSGAHIPHASAASGLYPDLARECWRSLPTHYIALLCTWAESTWPAVDRHGQQKHSICDTCGPCQSIRNIVKSISTVSWYLWVAQMPRSGDLAIFVRTTDRRQISFTPCACVRGNNDIRDIRCVASFPGTPDFLMLQHWKIGSGWGWGYHYSWSSQSDHGMTFFYILK